MYAAPIGRTTSPAIDSGSLRRYRLDKTRVVYRGPAKIDYRAHFLETVSFFTETLEFVFAALDLIEAGWGIKPWLQRGTSASHPFGNYCAFSRDNLQALKALLDATATEASVL